MIHILNKETRCFDFIKLKSFSIWFTLWEWN